MPLVLQDSLTNPRMPFNQFVCDNCGGRMGAHFIFRPEKFADVRGAGRTPNGRYYCNRSQTAWSGSYHQRQLRRTLETGYAG